MENRPKLSDPEEFALIKSVYFDKDLRQNENIDQLERLERENSRYRNINNNSR
jgi:hypothetical protein